MHQWRRQTFIVALCFAAVIAARFYFNRVLDRTESSPLPRGTEDPTTVELAQPTQE
jgi:hypothetical protein